MLTQLGQDTILDVERRADLLLRQSGALGPQISLELLDVACQVTLQRIAFNRDHPIIDTIWRTLLETPFRKAQIIASWFGIWHPKERTIYINQNAEPHSQRWAHAHELGHALLEHSSREFYSVDQYAEINDVGQLLRAIDWNVQEEAEANHFASYVLFPAHDWKEVTKKDSTSIDAAHRVRAQFGVSLIAACREIVQRSGEACALAILPRSGTASSYHPALHCSRRWTERISELSSDELLANLLIARDCGYRLPEFFRLILPDGSGVRLNVEVTVSRYAVIALLNVR